MNYVEKLRVNIVEELAGLPDELIEHYTLLGLIFGVLVDSESVHHAWSVWQNKVNTNHQSLIPFEDLSEEIQKLDDKYRDAIVRAVENAKN